VRQPFRFLAAIVFALLAAAAADAQCTADPSGTCAQHKHLTGSVYPYTEDFVNGQPNVDYGAGYVTIVEGCAARNYINFSNLRNVNAVIRGTVRIRAASAPPGSRFAIRFLVDDVPRGEYLRTLTGDYHQSEEVNVVTRIPAGQHRLAMQVWLVDGPGSMAIGISFMTAQGTPESTGAASAAVAEPMMIDSTWRQISETITIKSKTDVTLLVQGYFQVRSATPDASHLTVGFSLDGATSQHTIELGLPKFYPSGINVFDHYARKPGFLTVPAGEHTVSLWAIVRGSGSAVIEYRQVEAIGFDATNVAMMPTVEAEETVPLVVRAQGDGTNVFNHWLTTDCGEWTNLLEYTYPVSPIMNTNWIGEAYIEFLGTSNGLPQMVQVGVEVLNDPVFDANGKPVSRFVDADFSILEFTIPPGKSHKFLFTHPLWWGAQRPNHIRLLARSFTCFGQPAADFTVGKRHMAIRIIPTNGARCCLFD
jgi:hypothetical protein